MSRDDVDEYVAIDQTFADELYHYGILRKSGRYPWGSGSEPHQRNKEFLDYVNDLRKKGMTNAEIAKGLSSEGHQVKTTELIAAYSIASNEQRAAKVSRAIHLRDDRQMSNVAIGEAMGIPESSVRSLLNEQRQARTNELQNTAARLRDEVKNKTYVDVSEGTENNLGISKDRLATAVAILREEGYEQHRMKVAQVGTGKDTSFLVLAPPGTSWNDVRKNADQIRTVSGYTQNNGKTWEEPHVPVSIDSKRIMVNYKENGGDQKDGVLELRRNVDDISLGAARYAQVRVKVDGTHYLKGMAMYADDLPDGVDIRFNTNKTRADAPTKLDALKPIKAGVPDDNPFGALTRPKYYVDANGKQQLSKLNILNEEGSWDKWSKSISSQVLSKQSAPLAKRQLDLAAKTRLDEYDEIMKLTNPTIRKRLLQDFAEKTDASAVHLKAAALPRQRVQVILPIKNMKDTEVYAPNFNDGERVVLIRYPHGGIFEIPELTVNNRQREANRLIKNAKDGIGISAKVAERLSGADFDGDTVLVIPNNSRAIKTAPALQGLKNFDPKVQYKAYEGMKKIDGQTKQLKMGDVSNLITDMTILGAPHSEIVKAVRHSMVIIDAEKHNLNWKQSYKDNDIAQLKKKYQGDARSGATTLVSRASSKQVVDHREPSKQQDGGPIDKVTGEKRYTYTGKGYTKPGYEKVYKNGKVVEVPPQFIPKRMDSTKMAETNDARTLISQRKEPIEIVYSDYANRMKALANQARKSYLATPNLEYSPTAKKAYDPQVETLKAKLNLARQNKPYERQAQLLARTMNQALKDSEPDMDKADRKKYEGRNLTIARHRVGAGKPKIDIKPDEWEAIQAGAISNSFLSDILSNADPKQVKQLAMPRLTNALSTTKVARAKAMLASGYTQAEVADQLGVSASTINKLAN